MDMFIKCQEILMPPADIGLRVDHWPGPAESPLPSPCSCQPEVAWSPTGLAGGPGSQTKRSPFPSHAIHSESDFI